MYLILETNNDPMGGGSAYQFVKSEKDFFKAQKFVKENKGPWRSFVISKVIE